MSLHNKAIMRDFDGVKKRYLKYSHHSQPQLGATEVDCPNVGNDLPKE